MYILELAETTSSKLITTTSDLIGHSKVMVSGEDLAPSLGGTEKIFADRDF